MIDTLYIEEQLLGNTQIVQILTRFPHARQIVIQKYNDVFNAKGQNFRLQKNNPALILAEKKHGFLQAAPLGYSVGGKHNYYFSHMLNCLYDCRYCFLQGMFHSAHYVLFVNFQAFQQSMEEALEKHSNEDVWFFSGYYCDSLALEPVTGFIDDFLPFIRSKEHAWLELRTKSTQIRHLLKIEPFERCVVAFSLSPDAVIDAVEARTPPLVKRLEAMRQLQEQGWPVGIRFDPILYQDHWQQHYSDFFKQVFNALDVDKLHSISLGLFRLPQVYFKTVQGLYPDEPLFASPVIQNQGLVSYASELEQELKAFCSEQILQAVPEEIFFPCLEDWEL